MGRPAKLRRLVRHDDGARSGEHAADAVADRDPGIGDLGRSDAAHLMHALLQGVHAVHAGMHVREAAAIGVERQLAIGGAVIPGDEGSGLAARHKAQIFEAVDRQVGEGVVDHQVVDVVVGDAGFGKGLGAGDAKGARGGEVFHLADHRGLDALAGAEQVDRLSREVLGALGRNQDQRAAAIGDEATLQQSERVGDHPRVQHILDRDRCLEGGARVLARPLALHDRDHRQLLVRQAIGLHVAQDGNREQSRRPHRPIGLLELAGETARRDNVAGTPDTGAAALAMGDQYRLAEPRSDRRGGVADMDRLAIYSRISRMISSAAQFAYLPHPPQWGEGGMFRPSFDSYELAPRHSPLLF